MTGISYKTWKQANIALYIHAIRHYEARHDLKGSTFNAWELHTRECRDAIRAYRELSGRLDLGITDFTAGKTTPSLLNRAGWGGIQ